MRIRKWLGALMILVLMVVSTNGLASSGHGNNQPRKVGILLVAFGSSQASAQVSFENIDRKVKAAYPDIPVRWAYTSSIIRNKLSKQGKILDSPEVALAKMQDEKFTQLKDPNVFVGTVEGYPGVDLIKDLLIKKKISRAFLMPFISVAGDHAKTTWPVMKRTLGSPFLSVAA